LNSWQLRLAARCIRNGGVIAYPTEAVYGLGCDPFDAKAVDRLLRLKQRPAEKGLILIGACWEHIAPFIQEPTAQQRQLLEQSWPGPVTWLIRAQDWVPEWLRGKHPSIAVRLTAHPVAKALCDQTGQALISTSANPSHQAPAKTPFKVRQYFNDSLDYILNAPLGKNKTPSTIKDLETGAVLR